MLFNLSTEIQTKQGQKSLYSNCPITKRGLFIGKKALVMGLGRFGGGVDVAKFLSLAGAKVTITDLASEDKLRDSLNQLKDYNGITYHLGLHCAVDFEQADIIVVNPAVRSDNEYLALARRLNKIVTFQIGIFFQMCPAPIIGITGANGKSTTAALTAHLLKAKATQDPRLETQDPRPNRGITSHESPVTSHGKIWLSGNIGNQPLLTILDQIKSDDLVVLELSSFQLEQLAQIQRSPDIALLTNLTPNHLDRYVTFEDYYAAKENIFKFQDLQSRFSAVSIFNAEDVIANQWYEKYKSETGRTCVRFSASDVISDIRKCFNLPGRANLSNLAAAMTIARFFDIGDEQIKNSLLTFKALPYRLELVAEIDGVRWYNDSKSTTPQGAIVALEAFEKGRIIIIAGGYDKNLLFDRLGQKIVQSAKAVILLGQTAEKIAKAIPQKKGTKSQIMIEIVRSLAQAVEVAERLAEAGDVVVLSPACASYDMYQNYQQRGDEFVGLVKKLMNK
jgi:UDP-N-acetylmuramoylalanine--D-glutamate ligase